MISLRLFEASPAWTLEDDTLVSFDLSYTRALRLGGVDTTCHTDAELSALSAQLCDALSRVPDGGVLRFASLEIAGYETVLKHYRAQFPAAGIGAEIAGELVQHLGELSARRRELYCFVSTAAELPFSSYNPDLLGRRARQIAVKVRELHDRKQREVTRLCEVLTLGLRGAGLAVHALDGAGFYDALWRMANPVQSTRVAAPAYHPDFSLRSQLFATGLRNHLDSFEREGQVHRMLTLRLPPQHVLPTQMLELQGLPFPHQLVVTLRRLSDADALRRVETTRRQGHELDRVLQKLRGSERHSALPDHLVLQQQVDSDDVLARLARGEKLYEAALQLWLAAPNAAELERHTEHALTRFRALGQAEGAAEELRARFAFLSMLPGHHSLIGERFFPMLASRACDLLPVCEPHRGAADATALLSTRAGEVVGFHPFEPSLPAWNATVAGGTGSGKSFCVRTLLTGWLTGEQTAGRVVIATRGRDYHRYAEILGGEIHDVASDDPSLCLGPFPAPAALSGEGSREMLEHVASILALLVTEPGSSPDRQQRRLLFKTTERLYASLAADVATPTFDDWLATLAGVIGEDPEVEALGARIRAQLRFWLDGPFGPAFARNRTAEATKLAVWNLEPVQDPDTQGVVLAVLSGLIAQSIHAGPTVVVLDEVWALMKSAAGAALVETLYRTVRKQGSAIWTISQSMSDYTSLPDGCRSAILNNSPVKLFLAHDPSELELVRTTFKLNDRETQLLQGLRSVPGRFSEILGFFGSRRQVLRLRPTPTEYWLATSHPKDCTWEELARIARPDLSREDILKRLARRYPHGAIDVRIDAA